MSFHRHLMITILIRVIRLLTFIFCWVITNMTFGINVITCFVSWINGKAFLCHSHAWWHVSGQDRTSLSSRMCQHSWKVPTLTRSKTPLENQRHLAHYSCTAERWMRSVQTVHSIVALCEITNSSWLSSLGQFQARLSVLLFSSLL